METAQAALAERAPARRPGSAPRASSTCPTSSPTAPRATTRARSAPPSASGPTGATSQPSPASRRPLGRQLLAGHRPGRPGVDEGFRRIGSARPADGRAARPGLDPGRRRASSACARHAGRRLDHRRPRRRQARRLARAPTVPDLEQRLALIGGTSSCHMAVSREPRFIPASGARTSPPWCPGLWLTEGGQSATGALIDHVIVSHARGRARASTAEARGTTVYDLLNERLDALAATVRLPRAAHARAARAAVLPRQPLARAPTPPCAAWSPVSG